MGKLTVEAQLLNSIDKLLVELLRPNDTWLLPRRLVTILFTPLTIILFSVTVIFITTVIEFVFPFLADTWDEIGFRRWEQLARRAYVFCVRFNVLLHDMMPYILKLLEANRLDQIIARTMYNTFHNAVVVAMS